MDPNATWTLLAEAIQTGETDEAAELADDLNEWLARGGFPPRITGKPLFDTIVARSTCQGICVWDD